MQILARVFQLQFSDPEEKNKRRKKIMQILMEKEVKGVGGAQSIDRKINPQNVGIIWLHKVRFLFLLKLFFNNPNVAAGSK